MIHNIYEDTREEGERLQKVWLASGGSFGGLLRFVPSLPPRRSTPTQFCNLCYHAGANQEARIRRWTNQRCRHLVVTIKW